MSDNTITVVIADDHEIVRNALVDLLRQVASDTVHGFEVVGHASNGLEALALVKSKEPHLLFLDISMPFASGAEILHDIKRWSPDTRVIIFTGLMSAGLLAGLVERGVDGLFSKGSPLGEFREKLPMILDGVPVIAAELAAVIADNSPTHLTSREQQVLNMIVVGKSNKEIAKELFLSPKTIDKHRTSLMQKLNVHSVAQLMAKAIKEGLVADE